MKKLTRSLLCAACITACLGSRASALEYTLDAPPDYSFGRPTSVEQVYRLEESQNVDKSKNTALIPPGFGTPTSYLPGSGEYLTPNLVPGALSGGLSLSASTDYIPSSTGANVGATETAGSGWTISTSPDPGQSLPESSETATPPADPTQPPTFSWSTASLQPVPPAEDKQETIYFTDVTSDLYYSGGHLGVLKIPRLSINVKVYEGTSSTQLARGAGHFPDTSIWEGNVCLAGHNRGSSYVFGEIHTLNPGDKITLTTKLGTRTYSVSSVKKVSEWDSGDTAATTENCITLYTCVKNQSEYRWCVRAVEV